MFDYQPVLKGELVELRPLRADDYHSLFAVAADPFIWEQHPVSNRHEEETFQTFFHEALASGGTLVAIDVNSRQIIGSSRFHGHDSERSEVEIGWTFLARSHWGGRYNGEMKQLDKTVITGQPGTNHVYGQSFWEYVAEHPDDAAVFNGAMTAGADLAIPWILAGYDFSRFAQVVDVGGGHGALLASILSANRNVQGVLFDLPAVVAGADSLRSRPIADRCDIRGGDFFEDVPRGADAYVLNRVIHDWPALRILKNCRRAIKPDGRVLLIELVLTPSSQSGPGQELMDLLMLTLVGGRERNEADFRALLREAGFAIESVIRTPGPPSIVEARPA